MSKYCFLFAVFVFLSSTSVLSEAADSDILPVEEFKVPAGDDAPVIEPQNKVQQNNDSKSGRPKLKIIGGQNARIHEFPFMVHLEVCSSELGCRFCSGSIINGNSILTAAHCVYFSNVWMIRVTAGDHDISSSYETPVQIVYVKGILVHAGYTRSQNYHDVAILLLHTPLQINWMVQPACLSSQYLAVPGSTVTAIGWGFTSPYGGCLSSILQKVQLTVAHWVDCYRRAGTYNFNYEICALDWNSGRTITIGDNGAPLVFNDRGVYKQVGLASRWVQPAPGRVANPGLFTSIYSYRPWIETFVSVPRC